MRWLSEPDAQHIIPANCLRQSLNSNVGNILIQNAGNRVPAEDSGGANLSADVTSHYVPNVDNSHIDTSAFKEEVRKVLSQASPANLPTVDTWKKISELIDSKVKEFPQEPQEDQLICRYLSPTKFLWLVSRKAAYFGQASQFQDVRDSFVPEDYYNAVLKVLSERSENGTEWERYLRRQQGRWLVSCWTHIDSHFDDHLLWQTYAGGTDGVGITVTYGALRDHLNMVVSSNESISKQISGNVAYGSPLLIAPFCKRRFFRNENEIRFALLSDDLDKFELNLEPIWDKFGIRLSPDAADQHIEAIKSVWKQFGGGDEIHIAGG